MSLPKPRLLLLLVALVAVGFVLGRGCRTDRSAPGHGTAAGAAAEATVWTCAMHPQIRLPEPGNCPICFMELIPVSSGAGDEDLGPRTLEMTEAAMRLAEIETAPVERTTVAHEVSMVGKIAFDETRLAYITSWVPGRLDRLYVDYTGVTVRKGEHLVEIYSPKLYTAQQELLQALEAARRLEGSSSEVLRRTTDRTVDSAREKLRLYGLSENQIQTIVDRGKVDEHVTILAPSGGIVVHKNALEGMYVQEGTQIYTIADLSKVWVLLDAYETDLGWLRYGQDVRFRVQAFPGETFHGRIAFIDPVLDDRTRTIKVRLNVDNADLRLKPDMFVSATAEAVLTPHGEVVDEELEGMWMCPMHPEILADGPEECPECGMALVPVTELGFVVTSESAPSLVIPATAPLVTGKRAVVYVRVPGRDKPTFEGREVALGPRAGDRYVVHDGLAEGEQVVVKGNFKIDSELQIRAKPSMMSPQGGAPPPGHEHGGAPPPGHRHGDAAPPSGQGMRSPAPPPVGRLEAPAAFREQLGAVADAYLRVQSSLAGDEDAPSAAQDLLDALDAVDMELVAGKTHDTWMAVEGELRSAARALVAARDLEARRAAFAPLTAAVAHALDTFGFEHAGAELGVFHCPMALEGAGADWIQAGETTSNPYLGSAMPRCGERTRVLVGER